MPQVYFMGGYQGELRSQYGQKKRYKDTLTTSYKDFKIPPNSLEQIAYDQSGIICFIGKGWDVSGAKIVCEAE